MVVSSNKWTGAGAVAELSCRALRSAGVAARLLFVGGRNMERRLEDESWASPALAKDRSPSHLRANIHAIKLLADDTNVVICHLPHDHLLCVAAGVHRRSRLVRSFRNPRHIRRDPYHRFLDRRLSAAVLAHTAMGESIRHVPAIALPVPVDDRFRPEDGSAWRDRLGIPPRAPVVGAVGKLAKGRGFEFLLHAVARIDMLAHVVVVGHGERQPELRALASVLEIADRVHWAGYREKALPDLYAAMDIYVFAAPGSDWGHRAITEAQACGRPVVAVSHPGVEDLIEDGVSGRLAPPDSVVLASEIDALLANPERSKRLGSAAMAATETRRLEPIGRRLVQFLTENATLGR
jgi:glycosyltransferase involved in cell wall biosynthesis